MNIYNPMVVLSILLFFMTPHHYLVLSSSSIYTVDGLLLRSIHDITE